MLSIVFFGDSFINTSLFSFPFSILGDLSKNPVSSLGCDWVSF
eukprot:Gb_04220 [translate_table: standard]